MNELQEQARAADGGLMGLARYVRRSILPPSQARLGLWRSLLLTPAVFASWFQLRRLVWYMLGYRLRRLDPASGISEFVSKNVISHNVGNLWLINRDRTERLIAILRSVRSIRTSRARTLVIGPRNEAELLLLRAYGFSASKMKAIDLFSYSPKIQLMDMHAMSLPPDEFDVVYSCFVITYSDDIPAVVRETIRVARHGALAAFAFQHLPPGRGNKFGLNRLSGGTRELLDAFGPNVRHVLWAEDHVTEDGSSICSLIFQLDKRPGPEASA